MHTNVSNSELAAVTFGRFNVCTLAHVHAFTKIIERCTSLVICVIDDTLDANAEPPNSEFSTFYALADAQQTKTTFTLDERLQLLTLSVTDSGLSEVVRLETIQRPEYYPHAFQEKFPSERFQMVFPGVSLLKEGSFELVRNEYLPKILSRSIKIVPIDFELHLTDIRRMAAEDPTVWRTFLTPHTYDFFISIHGPERIKAI